MGFKLADKLGYSPPFQFTEQQEEEFYEGGIDYESLANKLAKASRFPFDYKNFANSPTTFTSSPLNGGVEYTVENNNHLEVTETLEGDLLNVDNVSDVGKEIKRKLNISGKLNKKTALVAVKKGKVIFSFKFKLNEYTKYVKEIKYEYLNETAIELTTFSYNDYSALSKHINTSDNPSVKALIIEKFNQAFSKVDKDVSSLKWLYENAPQFVLTQRGDDKLIADFKKLVTYDKDSWFKDASSAILNLLLGFNDISKAYSYFHDNPQETIKTYSILDSASQNQFCLVLDFLSKLFTSNSKRRNRAKFVISKNYTLNSNIFLSDNQEEILLEQSELTKKSIPARKRLSTTVPVPVEQQTQFHPLDLVTLVNEAGEEEIVTALHVKGFSDQAEWAQVISNTILVVSIIVIIVSAGTLAAGATGVVAAIAVTEIVVASLDILQEVLKSADPEKLGDAGKWFVKNWDKISGTHGVISLGGLLRKGVLKNGPKLLASIRAVNATENVLKIRKAVNAAILSIRIEFYFASRLGLTYCKILPFPDVVNFIGSKFANKMAKFGVNVTEPVEGSTDIKGLIYNGEKIAEGTKKEITALLKQVFPYADESKVIAKLDELLNESIGLIKRIPKSFKNVNYEVLVYKNEIVWKVLDNPKINSWGNKAKIYGGVLRFDFNTYGVSGLGQKWTDETFEFLNGKFKKVKSEWMENPEYPGGQSLGYKEFWNEMHISGDKFKAAKATTFYTTMESKGFGKIETVIDDYLETNVILTAKNN